MRRFRPILPALGLAAFAGIGDAAADDKADCKAGIAMIRSEFDECMDAVKDARKALGR